MNISNSAIGVIEPSLPRKFLGDMTRLDSIADEAEDEERIGEEYQHHGQPAAATCIQQRANAREAREQTHRPNRVEVRFI